MARNEHGSARRPWAGLIAGGLATAATVWLCGGCVSRYNAVSRRGFNAIDKEGTAALHDKGRETPDGRKQEVYVKTGTAQVIKKQPEDTGGSLYNLADEGNNLFTQRAPGAVGDYVDVTVDSSRLDKKKPAAPAQAAAPAAPAANAGGGLDDTLVKALPNLDAGENNPVIIKRFKVRVVERKPNGDVIAQFARESRNEDDAHAIAFTARVPGGLLRQRQDVTTNDLEDVTWNESENGEWTQRMSTGWEDEYTLRLSGFSEARSKVAFALEEKRKQLMDVRDQLENRIKALASERGQVAKQREELGKRKAEIEAKLAELEREIAEQKKTIAAQQSELAQKNGAAATEAAPADAAAQPAAPANAAATNAAAAKKPAPAATPAPTPAAQP